MAITTVRDDALADFDRSRRKRAPYSTMRLVCLTVDCGTPPPHQQRDRLSRHVHDRHPGRAQRHQLRCSPIPARVTASGAALTLAAADTAVLTQVQGQLQTLITLANGSVGNSATAATRPGMLHTTQTSIIDEINGDAALATALANNTYAGGTGADNASASRRLPTGADDAAAIAAATARGADAGGHRLGVQCRGGSGRRRSQHHQITQFNTDMKAIATGLTNLLNNPTALAAIESRRTQRRSTPRTPPFISIPCSTRSICRSTSSTPQYATNPNVAARATNDNLLDIIDIVQGDAALNTAAGGNGNAGNVGGFSEMPAYLSGTITRFQDNQAQTNFWAKFVAEGNVINNQLDNVAAGHNTTSGRIAGADHRDPELQRFRCRVLQGPGRRVQRALRQRAARAARCSPIPRTPSMACRASRTATPATHSPPTRRRSRPPAQGFVADAGDVSGNNIPLGGGTYVGDGHHGRGRDLGSRHRAWHDPGRWRRGCRRWRCRRWWRRRWRRRR